MPHSLGAPRAIWILPVGDVVASRVKEPLQGFATQTWQAGPNPGLLNTRCPTPDTADLLRVPLVLPAISKHRGQAWPLVTCRRAESWFSYNQPAFPKHPLYTGHPHMPVLGGSDKQTTPCSQELSQSPKATQATVTAGRGRAGLPSLPPSQWLQAVCPCQCGLGGQQQMSSPASKQGWR